MRLNQSRSCDVSPSLPTKWLSRLAQHQHTLIASRALLQRHATPVMAKAVCQTQASAKNELPYRNQI